MALTTPHFWESFFQQRRTPDDPAVQSEALEWYMDTAVSLRVVGRCLRSSRRWGDPSTVIVHLGSGSSELGVALREGWKEAPLVEANRGKGEGEEGGGSVGEGAVEMVAANEASDPVAAATTTTTSSAEQHQPRESAPLFPCVIDLDFSPAIMAQMARRFPLQSFATADARRLPLRGGSVDLLLCKVSQLQAVRQSGSQAARR